MSLFRQPATITQPHKKHQLSFTTRHLKKKRKKGTFSGTFSRENRKSRYGNMRIDKSEHFIPRRVCVGYMEFFTISPETYWGLTGEKTYGHSREQSVANVNVY